MDSFGVQKPSLKKLAHQPAIPALTIMTGDVSNIKPVDFLGGLIKSVDGLGDRSAYGLPDENGVIVINEGKGLLEQSKLHAKDVILMADGKKIESVKELLDIYHTLKNFNSIINLSIIRGQQQMEIKLKIK
ncbi:PDZ domain-containing protein [Niabella ginsengisoli]|uniref:PDZ domain-containing protein n=1 Tax=Niabella ginsengisoli TaxID=522298 RepID=A0ABS9SQZ1_9BACT|nr:PDZ domain-containing protein [Niabella ginsengisoli]MCH5600651.1 hypothetical protein [Niabella ginsengisoli]